MLGRALPSRSTLDHRNGGAKKCSILRTILEKLIDQFGATTVDECSTLLVAACHAINSSIHTHGRSAYQAVFGRQPGLVNSNFNDPMMLATSEPAADLNKENSAAYKAEFVRCEALKTVYISWTAVNISEELFYAKLGLQRWPTFNLASHVLFGDGHDVAQRREELGSLEGFFHGTLATLESKHG